MKFLKFVTVEELFVKKPKERRISPWFYADFWLCILLFFNLSGMFYPCFFYFTIFAMPIALVIRAAKPLYDRNKETPKYLKAVIAVLRSLVYTVLISVIVLPWTMYLALPWYYPVQRTVFLTCFGENSMMHEFLPKSVPLDAKNYEISFSPPFGDAGYARLYFNADAEYLQERKVFAESYGAEYCTAEDETAKKWNDRLEQCGCDTELYIFERYSGYAVYILNERTGYFELYWY